MPLPEAQDSTVTTKPEKTPLHKTHCDAGARMMPFGGFDMPLQYSGIVAEHRATRSEATLFDTCHMGEIRVRGPQAVRDLDRLLSASMATMLVGQCRYALMCTEDGGVIDDLIVYRMDQNEFFLVVNAGTRNSDFDWIQSQLSSDTHAVNESADTAKIDLQGPHAPQILQNLTSTNLASLRYFRWTQIAYAGRTILVSRTGYTGEIGFEFYSDANTAIQFWNDCAELGAVPAGLGARDTLRLEMGLPLYGHELSMNRNAGQSGLEFAIARDKAFVGSDSVQDTVSRNQTLCGIVLSGRRAARAGDRVQATDGRDIGIVTSGSFGPSVGCAIALAYVETATATPESPVILAGAGRLQGTLTPTPFYKNGTARKPIGDFLK
ncbi:MAG: glycine cleavage system aminomethyltransferase GcvT [Kiritimatiellae bacterium]|nr:glycine cleavage system aminomethyltransferase GcvT [Kiritimatiellia bacterium]